jgi:hypothetical protein
VATGLQLIAPEGYATLVKSVTYVLLRNDSRLRRVVLVSFHDKSPAHGRHPQLAILMRAQFEQGLVPSKKGEAPAIVPVTAPTTLPPWLQDLEGLLFDTIESYNAPMKGRVRSPRDEVDHRVLAIQPAIEKIEDILQAEDPDFELNRIARACKPKVNETRFRLWFYVYIAFGYRKWALLPPRSEWGKWDRLDEKYAKTKPGRPNEHLGKQFGFRTDTDMVDKILQGFRKFAGECDNLAATWAMTVRKIFGGKVKRETGKPPVVFHPQGKPLPSYNKFYYYCRTRIGQEQMRVVMYGETRIRNEETPNRGALMDDLANIGERAYFDSRQVYEYPKSYIGNLPLPPLHTVDEVDGASGQTSGLGCSLGSERSGAYRMSLFCAAIRKSTFGRIVGVPISDERWPGSGLPAALFSDRGAGASEDVRAPLRRWQITVEVGPSYDPKSDAAESKHPRRKRQAGAPTYKNSGLTVIEMFKREVVRVMMKNDSDDALARASDRAVVEGNVKTPNELYKYLASNHRTSLIQISFEDAVRAFLDKVDFEAKSGQLYLGHRQYSSEAVFTSGLAKKILHAKKTVIPGYVLRPFPRFAWIEFNGQLVEVEAKRDGADSAHLASLPERDQIAAIRSKASGKRQAQQKVEVLAGQEEFHEETGKEWHSGKTKVGRSKAKTKESQDEARRIKQPA